MARSRGGRRFRFRFRFHRRNLCAAAAYAAVLLIALSSFFTLISLSKKDGFEDRRECVSSEEEHPSEPVRASALFRIARLRFQTENFGMLLSVSVYTPASSPLQDTKVYHVAKSDSRLANNDLPLDIQRLRCRAMYNSLRFSPPTEILAKVLSMHDGETTEADGAAKGS